MSEQTSGEADPALHEQGHMHHQDDPSTTANLESVPDTGCQCGCNELCAAAGTVAFTIDADPPAAAPEHCGNLAMSPTRLLADPALDPPYRPPALRS